MWSYRGYSKWIVHVGVHLWFVLLATLWKWLAQTAWLSCDLALVTKGNVTYCWIGSKGYNRASTPHQSCGMGQFWRFSKNWEFVGGDTSCTWWFWSRWSCSCPPKDANAKKFSWDLFTKDSDFNLNVLDLTTTLMAPNLGSITYSRTWSKLA